MGAKEARFILWFDEIDMADVHLVGAKNAALGDMIRNLAAKSILVPNGFAITAAAYRYFLKTAGIEKSIRQVLNGLNPADMQELVRKGRRIRDLILDAPLPSALVAEIGKAYEDLEDLYGVSGADLDVAVRSSAVAEEQPEAIFGGQQETFLNIRGKISLIQAVKRCFASLFTNRAISYRYEKGIDQFAVALSVGVQKMVRSDAACSGVLATVDAATGFTEVVDISGTYGLGETIVQGQVTPDEYHVFKPTLKMDKYPIISKKMGDHKVKMIYTDDETRPVRILATSEEEQRRFVLTDEEIITLARWACHIEDYYTQASGMFRPMIIEWAKDGDGVQVGTGQLYIVQAQPETVHARRDVSVIETYRLQEQSRVIVTGQAVGAKIGQGPARLVESSAAMAQFQPGEVLVTDMTDPDWEPMMRAAAAIVTNRGGRTCHAAIVSRELGIPCVIGTEKATSLIQPGQKITVSCAAGETGLIYDGLLAYEVDRVDLKSLPSTRTQIMLNVGHPEQAFLDRQIPNQGVGLARQEFIINTHIGIHPLALIHYDQLQETAATDPRVAAALEQIDERTKLYPDKKEYFVDRLAQGIARIAAAFYPKDVIVRLSDFKSNEYANLIAGFLFEPVESNPMLGWRGASRYYDPKFQPAFALECRALRRVRQDMGLTNVKILVPFCRTPEEGARVLDLLATMGLVRGQDGLEVYVMVEVPSNVLLGEEFAKIFDGFSIGSNDLTQLTLGLDRDSELVFHLFDERHPAMLGMIKTIIDLARKHGRKIGICGQAPSDYPEFAAFLVECGIDSISLSPDTVIKTMLTVAKKEQEMGSNG
ncbi:MAG: phosphoenolpyruvate synthase [Desulfobacca sp.]|uniref:phosphoenolpyruvate synthase n=1 Tax=Desulfobacca sp. TaxID=2067990 RepID=UPI00404AABD0